MCRKLAPWMAVCAWILTTANAWADGVMLNGISPRSLSRGGTDQGFADNGGIIYDNPGSLVNIEGDGLLDIGTDMLIVSGHYADPGNDVYTTTFTPLPQIGIVKKSADGNWAAGFGVFTPAGFSESYRMQGPFPLLGEHKYESFGALIKIPVALSYRVNDRLSIGGSIGVGVSYAELEGPYFLQGPGPFTGTPTLLRTHGAGADFIWSAGMQYMLTDATTIGATYQSASPFRLSGNSSVTVPGLGSSSYDSELHMEWPQSVAVGVRHCLCAHRTIAADVIWFDWSHSFDEFALNLHNPGNPFFPPQIVDHFPLDWRDSVSVRLGYEQLLDNGVTFRMGYVYHRNPIPDNTLTPFIQAFLEHAVSVGFSWKWNCWDVDLGYMHLFGPRQHVDTSAFVGGDFNNSTHGVMVDAILLSFMRKF